MVHFHRWGKWSAVYVLTYTWRDGTKSYERKQQRSCDKCGKIKERDI